MYTYIDDGRYSMSILFTLFNKWFLTGYPYPIFSTMMHFWTKWVVTRLLTYYNIFELDPLPSRSVFWK